METIRTYAPVAQATASIFGFFFLILQVRQLIRNTQGATHDRLYAHYMEVCKLFMQKPELRPYFYEGKELQQASSDQQSRDKKDTDSTHNGSSAQAPGRGEIDAMSEAIFGLIEHAVMQHENLPEDTWNNCWRPYVQERLTKSIELQRYFVPNPHWYAVRLDDVVDEFFKTHPHSPVKNDWDALGKRPRQGKSWRRFWRA